jgi:hypothetical protein
LNLIFEANFLIYIDGVIIGEAEKLLLIQNFHHFLAKWDDK